MMLKPSIDKLLEQVNSKYSLVILSSKRAHELEEGADPTIDREDFKSVTPVQQALEEIEAGRVINHPNPEAKRERIRRDVELAKQQAELEQEKLKQQIEAEQNKI